MLRVVAQRSGPVTWCMVITLFAGEHAPEHAISAIDCGRPRPIGPRRVVANVLVVTAFELGDPMLLRILNEPNDSLVHEALAPPMR